MPFLESQRTFPVRHVARHRGTRGTLKEAAAKPALSEPTPHAGKNRQPASPPRRSPPRPNAPGRRHQRPVDSRTKASARDVGIVALLAKVEVLTTRVAELEAWPRPPKKPARTRGTGASVVAARSCAARRPAGAEALPALPSAAGRPRRRAETPPGGGGARAVGSCHGVPRPRVGVRRVRQGDSVAGARARQQRLRDRPDALASLPVGKHRCPSDWCGTRSRTCRAWSCGGLRRESRREEVRHAGPRRHVERDALGDSAGGHGGSSNQARGAVPGEGPSRTPDGS